MGTIEAIQQSSGAMHQSESGRIEWHISANLAPTSALATDRH